MTKATLTRCIGILLLVLTMLTGCSNQPAAVSTSPTPSQSPVMSETPVPSEEVPQEIDINKNDTGKTVIKTISLNKTYPNNSYMIISEKGTVIVADPTSVVDGIIPDVITMTHSHADHMDRALLSKYPDVKTSRWVVESFEVEDVKVTSLVSSHSGDTLMPSAPSNVIYIFEVDGLRIAHMGDIGQSVLTEEQLATLGKIDIVFMQFVNSYSNYDMENQKGFTLIEQLKPQIIIPTHSTPEANQKIGEIVGAYETAEGIYVVSEEDLADGKRKVVELKNTLVSN